MAALCRTLFHCGAGGALGAGPLGPGVRGQRWLQGQHACGLGRVCVRSPGAPLPRSSLTPLSVPCPPPLLLQALVGVIIGNTGAEVLTTMLSWVQGECGHINPEVWGWLAGWLAALGSRGCSAGTPTSSALCPPPLTLPPPPPDPPQQAP